MHVAAVSPAAQCASSRGLRSGTTSSRFPCSCTASPTGSAPPSTQSCSIYAPSGYHRGSLRAAISTGVQNLCAKLQFLIQATQQQKASPNQQ